MGHRDEGTRWGHPPAAPLMTECPALKGRADTESSLEADEPHGKEWHWG